MYTFICYPKCTTCQKAQKWLDAHGVAYTVRHIKEQNPAADELRAWRQASGLPLKRFFNTSGQLYRGMGLSAKLPDMPEDEQFALLASDGMMVKRPLLVADDGTVLVGFKEAEWARALGAEA
ncbi:arsenate reductase family protein [Intestinibacillus massiliensis]|uniref:arsenate reductase family protein n=1 Tax=Intestinibacillus massiliensis TaxID=1871029 RepID=UPI000B3608F2|nr:arsenate reductase family protein [Intestinibacillus massiliensis]